jgi:hypothetical protein
MRLHARHLRTAAIVVGWYAVLVWFEGWLRALGEIVVISAVVLASSYLRRGRDRSPADRAPITEWLRRRRDKTR